MPKKQLLKKNKLTKNSKEIKKDAESVVSTINNSTEMNNITIKSSNIFSKSISIISDPKNFSKIFGIIFGLALIGGMFAFNFYYIPEKILTQTDTEKAKSAQKKAQEEKEALTKANQDLINKETEILKFENNKKWQVAIKFNDYDELKVDLNIEDAPKTVENFIRLTYRKYYDDTKVHRIVKEKDMVIIQGGDKENGNGTGGKSAFYINDDSLGLIPDELWLEQPKFGDTAETQGKLINEPKFRNENLYKNLNKETGTVEYKKGLILIAKTDSPNSATSQYFITLDNSILPAQYTVFGVISEEYFSILDKIKNDFNPITKDNNNQSSESADQKIPLQDGEPNGDLKLKYAKIINPEI